MNTHSELADVRERVLDAFPKDAPPDAENLASHRCDECDRLRDDFAGVEWWSAAEDLIEASLDTLPLFTPEAFHYYLPAFILHSIDNFEPDSSVLEFTIYNLEPGNNRSFKLERRNKFTPDQADVIVSFLQCVLRDQDFYRLHDDAEEAKNYWRVIGDLCTS